MTEKPVTIAAARNSSAVIGSSAPDALARDTLAPDASATISGGRPTLWLDCSATVQFDGGTGIQRVVRNIVWASTRSNGADPSGIWHCRSVRFLPARGFVPCPPPELQPNLRPKRGRAWQIARTMLNAVGLKHVVHRELVRSTAGVAAIRRQLRRTPALPFQPGDSLLLLDASWSAAYWGDIRQLQRLGLPVGAVIYDLLPLTRPNDFPPHIRGPFQRWWRAARQTVDYFVTISDDVAAEVRRHLPPGRDLPIKSFRLGADLDLTASAEGPSVSDPSTIRPHVAEAFAGPPVFLWVGTLNPRKDYETALTTLERLRTDGPIVRFVIAGRFGWGAESIAARLREQSGTQDLIWLEGISDSELRFAYRHAAAVVTTSRAEGFNLPLVEALHHGTAVIASDLPVHREVCGEYATYFPAGDPAALAALIRQANARPLTGPSALAAFHWPNWAESATELLSAVPRPAKRPRS